jgi:hypothetical protein
LALAINDKLSILLSVKFSLNRLGNIPVFRRLDHYFLSNVLSLIGYFDT